MSVAVNVKTIYSLPEENPEQRLEFHLDNWRRWMRSDVITDGAPNRAAGCIGGGYSRSFEDMIDSADVRCALTVDALIEGLSPGQRAAIHHCYLRAVFRFPRGNYEDLLAEAKRRLDLGLMARGVY